MATTATESRSESARGRSWAPDRIGDAQVEIALAVAMVGAILLGVWLGRDTTYSPDEMYFFSSTPHLGLQAALEPYNGHLVLVPRLIYAAVLHTSGASYFHFRLLGISSVLLTTALFFVFARRRVGALVALAPALVLLFFGSDAYHAVSGNGLTICSPKRPESVPSSPWSVRIGVGTSSLARCCCWRSPRTPRGFPLWSARQC